MNFRFLLHNFQIFFSYSVNHIFTFLMMAFRAKCLVKSNLFVFLIAGAFGVILQVYFKIHIH